MAALHVEADIVKIVAHLVARFYLRKPELADLIAIKLCDFRTLFKAVANEICYILRSPVSYKLISINIELTNTCNLHCRMCPVGNGRMKRPGVYLKPELFEHIIDQNPDIDFILIFQWGESLLHEKVIDLIQYARLRGVRTFLTTNGTLLDRPLSRRIIQSGLDRITFSVDGTGETYERIRGFDFGALRNKIIEFKNIRDHMKSSLKIDVSMVVSQHTEGDVAGYRRKWEGLADRVQLIPVFANSKRSVRCRELWRGTLTVLADGKVVPCCADYDGVNVVGDARTQKLSVIWNSSAMRHLRKAHGRKRFQGICNTCGEFETPYVSKRFE